MVKPLFKKLIIAIDFDGTIVEHKYPSIGKLLPQAKVAINKLHEMGHFIIIWTCRGDHTLVEMIEFLKKNDVRFHKVNENAPYEIIGFIPAPKIYADIYIDDRNLGGLFQWSDIFKMITGQELI
jgi:hydroxymethylpyrimidine pyrophosphatase-like HAD family hydrolase